MVLLAVLAILIWYAHDSAENPKDVGDGLSIFLIVINGHLMLVAIVTMSQFYYAKPVSVEQTTKFQEALKEVSMLEYSELQELVNEMSEWDRYYIFKASGLLRVEHMGKFDEQLRLSKRRSGDSDNNSSSGSQGKQKQADEQKLVEAPPPSVEEALPSPVKREDGKSERQAGGDSTRASSGITEPIFPEVPPDSHITPRSSARIWQGGLSTPRVIATPVETPATTPRDPPTPRRVR
jgi:hypothetical protein